MRNGTLLGSIGLCACLLCACSNGSGSVADPPTSSFAFVSRQAVSVSDCPTVTGQSPNWCNTYWPPALRGTVYLYTFTETRLVPSTYPTLTRTAYVYKPVTTLPLVGRYPMLVYLHGGTQTADQMFSLLQFAQLADGRSTQQPLFWAENTAICQYAAKGAAAFGLGGTSSTGFVNSSGQECGATLAQYSRPTSAGPFYVVYPNGIPDFDGGGNSWEDGRTPSPGQYDAPDPNQPKRDDVGFIDALIAEVKSRETAVDAGRVYVAGMSNGGVMTHRLLCNLDNASYPELGQVAAFAVLVSSMANNLYTGANGMEQCPRAGSTIAPLAIFVGYGFPTPNSKGQKFYANCNPYNPSDPRYPNLPACPYAPVSGDDTIPYGTALDVSGGVFTVNSPSLGDVISSPDDQAFWRRYLTDSGAGAATEMDTAVGFFTQIRHYDFANSPAALQIYQVDHGLHQNGGSRFDFSLTAQVYDFLFEFARRNGAIATTGGVYDSATATYGNLSGSY